MTTLERFQSLDVKARESFISALGMFRELDAAYRAKINAQKTETSSRKNRARHMGADDASRTGRPPDEPCRE